MLSKYLCFEGGGNLTPDPSSFIDFESVEVQAVTTRKVDFLQGDGQWAPSSSIALSISTIVKHRLHVWRAQ